MLKTILLLIVYLITCSALATQEIFVYFDENGRKVFSDTKPDSQDYTTQAVNEATTTQWATVTPLKNKSPKKRPEEHNQGLLIDCIKLSKTIGKAESLLKTKLKAEVFDRVKIQLNKDRWQYQKKC